MQIHKAAKIETCVSKDQTRYVLTSPYLDIRDGGANVVATDGKCMAVVPVKTEVGETSGWVPIESLKIARKKAWGKIELSTLAVSDTAVSVGDSTVKRPDLGRYPDWRNVVPEYLHDTSVEVIKLCIDPSLLVRVADAIGADGLITMELPLEKSGRNAGQILSAITVRGSKSVPGAFGLVMPARCS